MFERRKSLDKISVGQLQIYLAVAKHELRMALLERRSLLSKIETLVRPEDREIQMAANPEIKMLVERKIQVREKCEQIWKQIAVLNLLLEFKNNLLQSESHRTSQHYKSFSEFIASKSLEDECRECEVTLISNNNRLERILLPHTPDKSEVQRVLRNMGLPEKEIAIITNDYPVIEPQEVDNDRRLRNSVSETFDSEYNDMDELRQKKPIIHLETH